MATKDARGNLTAVQYEHSYSWTAWTVDALRASLREHGFDEILPAILSGRYEPGARHSIAVLGDRQLPTVEDGDELRSEQQVQVSGKEAYYLPVSHCVEKQLALEHMDRVYCVAPCVRLLMDGEERTGRHLFTFFQVEIEWRTESTEDVFDTIESMLRSFAGHLAARVERAGVLSDLVADRLKKMSSTPYERLPFREARSRVHEAGGSVNPHAAGDLTHAEEKELATRISRPAWLTDYPDGVRDSLYRWSEEGHFRSYDLLLPDGFGEVATGGLRPASGEEIRGQAKKFDATPHQLYADWKDRTHVQTGGLGFGLERLISYCSGVDDVLQLRFAHDQGPNSSIGVATP